MARRVERRGNKANKGDMARAGDKDGDDKATNTMTRGADAAALHGSIRTLG